MRQTTESIDELARTFLDRAKFCLDVVSTEKAKIDRFYAMLTVEFRDSISPSSFTTLVDLINRFREREVELRSQETRGEKRKREIVEQVVKKIKGGSPSKKPFSKFPPRGCKLGHNRADCPELTQGGSERKVEIPKPNGRAFHISAEEARNNSEVVSGIFKINSLPALILFDSGASRSFVCLKFVKHYSFLSSKLDEPLEIEAENDKSFLVTKNKVIQLVSPTGESFYIEGEKKGKVILCSYVKATKYMARGCNAYMACVADVIEKVKDIRDVPIVNHFEDVFPDELPGVPPEREVEFGIDLIPGAKPVAKALYRLAPPEMKELMEQLQELLDKGFIRLSVSP
ncbi:hypothetical protein L1987_24909 [Smallanthus sonchifolius]|uniref:Uncharacterized protein n=1 Tax=Smallanthus sonchifolius TaxID=185202 RepID=A0ACB9IN74_9ASTR|nr:hypothetical protein L1987_24909 [Smallanthus sonchifolius]